MQIVNDNVGATNTKKYVFSLIGVLLAILFIAFTYTLISYLSNSIEIDNMCKQYSYIKDKQLYDQCHKQKDIASKKRNDIEFALQIMFGVIFIVLTYICDGFIRIAFVIPGILFILHGAIGHWNYMNELCKLCGYGIGICVLLVTGYKLKKQFN